MYWFAFRVAVDKRFLTGLCIFCQQAVHVSACDTKLNHSSYFVYPPFGYGLNDFVLFLFVHGQLNFLQM